MDIIPLVEAQASLPHHLVRFLHLLLGTISLRISSGLQ